MSDSRITLYLLCVLFVLTILQVRSVKSSLGECPDTTGTIGICIFDPTIHCLDNNQCPFGYRCCPSGCNSVCSAVTVNPKHPGSCPSDLAGKLTGSICKTDNHCKAYEKCCRGRCVAVRKSSSPLIQKPRRIQW